MAEAVQHEQVGQMKSRVCRKYLTLILESFWWDLLSNEESSRIMNRQ